MDNTHRWSVGEMTDRFSKLDYMTQRTIEGEFPEFFGVRHTKVNYATNNEHFTDRKFSMSEFFGGFCLVLGIITILGRILPFIVEWLF